MAPTKHIVLEPVSTPGVGPSLSQSLSTRGCPHIELLFGDPRTWHRVLRAYELAVRLCIEKRRGMMGRRTGDDIHAAHTGRDTKNNHTHSANTELYTKINAIKCQVCSQPSPSTFCCLLCSFTGCRAHFQSTHHAATQHVLAVDLVPECVLYCSGCNDYVFDTLFDRLRSAKMRQFLEIGLPGLPAGSVLEKEEEEELRARNGEPRKRVKLDTQGTQKGGAENDGDMFNDTVGEEEKENDSFYTEVELTQSTYTEEDPTSFTDTEVVESKDSCEEIPHYTDPAPPKRGTKNLGPGYDIVQTQALLPSYQATCALRGFYNLGSTCFISVIFQSLLHNPLVRNFYLSGGHERGLMCSRRHIANSTGNDGHSPADGGFHSSTGRGKAVTDLSIPINCLACSLDEVFTEFFTSSSVAGFGPTGILATSFQIKQSLGGNSQQDAHEFLQVVLNELHSSHYDSNVFLQGAAASLHEIGYDREIPDTLRKTEEVKIQSCGCVSHRTFCGELESRIICQVCGTVSSIVVDPIMDLSLEIRNVKKKRGGNSNGNGAGINTTNGTNSAVAQSRAGTPTNGLNGNKKSNSQQSVNERDEEAAPSSKLDNTQTDINHKAVQPDFDSDKVSLEECLIRYTSGEKLDATFNCETCQAQRHIEKKLSIKRLPSVLAIQLKLFSHTGSSSKIETHVDFPLVLDMNKFTTEGADGQEKRILYELFGVICHQGSLNTGHYTCMMKTTTGRWFHFDDAMVTTIGVNQVLEKNAYLLFYIVQQVPNIL